LIHFASVDLAVAAVAALNSVVMNDRAVHVRMDRDSEVDLLGSFCIYVGNIPWQTTEEELQEAFSSFSPHHCKVMKNMSGRSRGFAVLKFRTEEASLLAINAMNNSEIGGRRIEVRRTN
jgi:RNA recognition motif-containing protein